MYSKQRCSVGRVQFHHISSTQHDILQCLINFLCCTQTCLRPTDSRYNKQMNRCFMCGTNLLPTTIPETKIAPENWWFEDYIPFEKRGTFSCAPLKLREGVAPSHPASSRLCMVLNSNCASWSSLSGSLPANGESEPPVSLKQKNGRNKCLNPKMPNAKCMSIYLLYKSINVTKSKI